jgi:hypothetical protein
MSKLAYLARKRRAKPWQNQGSEFGFSENPGSGFCGSNAAFLKKALEIISDCCIIFLQFYTIRKSAFFIDAIKKCANFAVLKMPILKIKMTFEDPIPTRIRTVFRM